MMRPDLRVPPERAQREAVHGQAPGKPQVRKQARGVSTTIVATIAVGAAYFAAAKLGMGIADSHPRVASSWPAAGVALAAVLLGGYRMLIGIALGAFFANATTGSTFAATLGITIGVSVEAGLGTALLRRAGFRATLERMRDVVTLGALAGVISTAIGATIAVGSLLLFGEITLHRAPETWRIWWLGDMGGVLLLATAVLVLSSTPMPRERLRPGIAAGVLCALLAGISGVVLSYNGPFVYVVFPTLFLLALVYRQQGAVLGGLVIAAIGVWFTARGRGPFIVSNRDADIVRALTLVSVGTIA